MNSELYPRLALYIDGAWQEGEGGTGPVILNPATEAVLARLPMASVQQLSAAASSSWRGFERWRDTPPEMRAEVLLAAARLLKERAAQIAPVMTLEHGKPLLEARGEVVRSAQFLEWCANEGRRAYGRIIPGAPGMRQMVLRKPVGPVAAFTPWNFPLLAPVAKAAAALAAGCSIVIKPAEQTPGGAIALVQALADAGLPAGVVNLVTGDPAQIAETLIAAPEIRMITLTGSIAIGKRLAELAACQMKPALLELGGHAPAIVCADADPVIAARNLALAKFRNSGQVCVSPSRFLVHEKVYASFVETFASIARFMKVGDGMVDGMQFGPLANRSQVARMEAFVADAVAHGARIVAGGRRGTERGFFFEPTVLADVPATARVMTEELFGPIAPVSAFSDLNAAIAQANSLPYGLAAYAFTESSATAALLADRLDCGLLSINHPMGGVPEAPFGGVKQSGYGREGGAEGIEAYLVTQFVSQRASAV
jgi:succinate-semialdehyde dehydrogenase/glutarate-semialdehyde dehydrogenase